MYLSSVDGALGWFHFGAINNVAVNIDLYVSVWACFYFPVVGFYPQISQADLTFSWPFLRLSCLYSFFSSWVVLHLFRPGAQSLLLHGSFLTVQLSWNLFSSALVI